MKVGTHYAPARKEHRAKREDPLLLTVEERLVRRAIEQSSAVTVIEYEYEVEWTRGDKPSLLWFDCLVWAIDEVTGQPVAKGLVDLLPHNARGNEPAILAEKQEYVKLVGIAFLQTPADELTKWRIRHWARKLARERRE